jgi:hypothetical protein
MAADRVTIELHLGSEAMKTPQDVAAKLDQLSDLFNGFGALLFPGGRVILDRKGNVVGKWEAT